LKKILVVCQQFSEGGIAAAASKLNASLIRFDTSVEVMAPSFSAKHADIPIPSLNLPGLFGSVPFWEMAIKLTKKKMYSYDLVILHHPVMFTKRLKDFDGNLLVIFHGTYSGYVQALRHAGLKLIEPYQSIQATIERKFLETLSNNQECIKVTGVSPSTILELRSNGYRGVAHFVPNAIPTVHSPTYSKADARKILDSLVHFKIEPEDVVLLHVGSATNSSGRQWSLSLKFFEKIAAVNPKLKLVAVGRGIKLAKNRDKNNVFCLGYVPKNVMQLLYASADVFVSLACYGGLSMAALEAASCGLPLILSDIPSHKFILSEHLGNGVLVDSVDPLLDLSRIENFLASLKPLRHYPSVDIQEKYSWDEIAKSYLRIGKLC
jgi:glycosyltransferase involved in cell wall biosynthesis